MRNTFIFLDSKLREQRKPGKGVHFSILFRVVIEVLVLGCFGLAENTRTFITRLTSTNMLGVHEVDFTADEGKQSAEKTASYGEKGQISGTLPFFSFLRCFTVEKTRAMQNSTS